MRKLVIYCLGMWVILVCASAYAIAGCGASIGEFSPEPLPDKAVALPPETEPLLVRLAREEPCNSSRIVLGEEFACLAVYEIVNARDTAAFVRDAEVWVDPQPAYSAAGIEWDHLHSAIPNMGAIEPNGTVNLSFEDAAVELEPHSSKTFRIWALVNPVATTLDPTVTQPRSGDETFVDILGVTELDARHAVIEEEITGPLLVIRKSRPTVTIADAPTRSMRDGRHALFEWTVKANSAGSIGVKQFAFHLDFSGVEMCDFLLQRNEEGGATLDVDILAIAPDRLSSADLREGCLTKSNDIVVAFHDEHLLLPDAATSFLLVAQARVIDPSAKMKVNFLRTKKVVTDALGCGEQGFVRFVSNATMLPGILWSDRSSVVHAWMPCASSRDWIGDALVADLDRSQSYDASL